jgi:hypothetical protein
MSPQNRLQASVVSLVTVQLEIAVLVEAMQVIRNISEGRAPWRDQSLERRIRAIQALSDLMHNFIPGDPMMLSVVRSQFEKQRERSPEAFELCSLLVHWVTTTDVTEGKLMPEFLDQGDRRQGGGPEVRKSFWHRMLVGRLNP